MSERSNISLESTHCPRSERAVCGDVANGKLVLYYERISGEGDSGDSIVLQSVFEDRENRALIVSEAVGVSATYGNALKLCRLFPPAALEDTDASVDQYDSLVIGEVRQDFERRVQQCSGPGTLRECPALGRAATEEVLGKHLGVQQFIPGQ